MMERKGTKIVLVGPKRSRLSINGTNGKDGRDGTRPAKQEGINQKIKKVISSHAYTHIWSGI